MGRSKKQPKYGKYCCAGGYLDDSHIPGNQSQKFPKDEKIALILGTIHEKTQDRFQSIILVYPMTQSTGYVQEL